MWILLSFISFLYAFLFYVLFSSIWSKSFAEAWFFPSLLFPFFLFIIIWVFFLIIFSKYSPFFLENKKNRVIKPKKDFKKIGKELFFSYSHYLSYFFFYLSIFLLSKYSTTIHFWYCILLANIFVFWFFHFFRNLHFSKAFLRINQIIFSLIYLVSYAVIFFTKNNFFLPIDFFNSILIIVSFFISVHYDKDLRSDNFFIVNFFLYVYGVIIFYLNFLFTDIPFFITIIHIILSIIIIWYSRYGNVPSSYKVTLRAFWVVLWYIWMFVWLYYLIYMWLNSIVYFFIALACISNFLFHKTYQNYISLFFSIVWFSFLLFIPSFWNINWLYNYIFILFFSYFLIFYTYFFEQKFEIENYFIHFLSYIYNFVWIIFFLIFYSPSILQVALLMFIEFIYLFTSYYKLTVQKRLK